MDKRPTVCSRLSELLTPAARINRMCNRLWQNCILVSRLRLRDVLPGPYPVHSEMYGHVVPRSALGALVRGFQPITSSHSLASEDPASAAIPLRTTIVPRIS